MNQNKEVPIESAMSILAQFNYQLVEVVHDQKLRIGCIVVTGSRHVGCSTLIAKMDATNMLDVTIVESHSPILIEQMMFAVVNNDYKMFENKPTIMVFKDASNFKPPPENSLVIMVYRDKAPLVVNQNVVYVPLTMEPEQVDVMPLLDRLKKMAVIPTIREIVDGGL